MDARAVAQEVQDQLKSAIHKGHEQIRKGQEQFRKGQEQFRKGNEHLRNGHEQVRKSREAVASAIRTGNEFAQSHLPHIASVQAAKLRLPLLTELNSPAKVRASAHDLATQVAAGQRKLAGRALHAASPLLAHGAARLSQVADTLTAERRPEHAESAASVTAGSQAAQADEQAEQSAKSAHGQAADQPTARTAASAATAKPAATRTGSTRTGTRKPAASKAADKAKEAEPARKPRAAKK
jgi:hypothetical protein